MWNSDNKQDELEKDDGALGSHKCSKKHTEKTASTQQDGDVANSEIQSPSITVTPATPQPRNTTQSPPSTSGSERTLTADSPVVMASLYRINENDHFPPEPFSKDLLIRMDHNKHHLEIDLFRPESERSVFPLQDLSPLCLYRELRTLKIIGMMQSYQSYIWLVVWLNPQLTDLTLGMAGEAESLDVKAIAEAQKYAMCKPTMREVAQGKTKAEVPKKFQIVKLSLTNFIIHDAPFRWFSDTKLQKVELHRCKDAGFQLPVVMERGFSITVTV
ncbi:hypothetical protein IMSHALPRED_010449 [Imshaugia aleurites]|uniref:Uncharacterized protein n=1 Tax=Imshaugia aleurites TaxID=172621 RepID=A0A8H3IQ01_9LECA|nr:hypothetical protein IMSHALPRED_010449 [Imshaugia aleurites]